MRKPTNLGALVRARLLALARQRKQPFQVLLTRYVLERLLYRLSTTAHRDRFVLKGAMLLTSWFPDPLRPTQDLDLLGFGNSDADAMLAIFREVCAVAVDDGVTFDVAALSVDLIREELEYGGLRLKTFATIDGARVRVVVDIVSATPSSRPTSFCPSCSIFRRQRCAPIRRRPSLPRSTRRWSCWAAPTAA